MKNRLTVRIVVLMLVAATLCLYLVRLLEGIWVLASILSGIAAIAGAVALINKLVRIRRISMKMLVFVLPLVTALAALFVGETIKCQNQQKILKAAGVHATRASNGIYGRWNSTLVKWFGSQFYDTFPAEISELGFQVDSQNAASVDRLPLNRLQRVLVFATPLCSGSVAADSTIDWLNSVPKTVHVELLVAAISESQASKLSELLRPMDSVRVSGKLSNAELASVFAIPTNHLGLSGVGIGDLDESLISSSSTRSMTFYQVPFAMAIKIARCKNCTVMTFTDDVSHHDCRELASLPLEELCLREVDLQELQILLSSPTLRKLEVSVRGVNHAERERIITEKSSRVKLQMHVLP